MAGIITALVLQKRNQERVNVFVDEQFACAISLEQAMTLRKGMHLSEADLAEMRAGGELDLAYQRVLRYLAARPRSTGEIGAYLQRKGVDEAVATTILEKLRTRGYVDDEAFAQFWVENRNRFRPRGARALRHELRQKGVESEIIDETLAEQDEDASAWSAIASKASRWADLERKEFDQKVMGLLARRGFGYDVCRRISQRAWDHAHGESDYDEGDVEAG